MHITWKQAQEYEVILLEWNERLLDSQYPLAHRVYVGVNRVKCKKYRIGDTLQPSAYTSV
jgi:hypothetical protein